MEKTNEKNYYNCILGMAVGDALGYPVRDKGYDEIVEDYGKKGVTEIIEDCDNRARITANMQTTIFEIDALIRAFTKYYLYGITNKDKIITYTALVRWQYTQGRRIYNYKDVKMLEDNYLMDFQELKYDRGLEKNTCEVLEKKFTEDKIEDFNTNKGFLCLAKSIPVGLVFYRDDNKAFDMAIKLAKITHGHPSAHLSCGTLAVIIANIVRGNNLKVSIENALDILKKCNNNEEVIKIIKIALKYARDDNHYPEKLDEFGLCDDAHELLGASIYISLIYSVDVTEGLLASVNNSCLSNNIGCIVGGILGLLNGLDENAVKWSEKLELKDLYKSLAYELNCVSKNDLPKGIEDFDKTLSFDEIKYNNEFNLANWWLIKYDKD